MSLPHICIDATCIVPNGKGATVYALSLLKALHQLNPPARFTVLIRQEAIDSLQGYLTGWTIQGVKVKTAHLWRLFALHRLLHVLKPDLLYVMGEAALGWLPVPYLLSIHELPHLYRKRTGANPRSWYQWVSQQIIELTLPYACRHATHVLALSHSTAKDLVSEFNLHPQQVSVAYPAADIRFFQGADPSLSAWCQALPYPYFLTFATGDRREIPEQVVQALGIIASQIPHYLVIAGRCPDWQKAILTDVATQAGCLERLHFTGFVPDAALPSLYQNAAVYVEISCYEGFGLQVCEAMATGTPAIASDVASLPEVIGNVDYLVPLNESQILAEKLFTLLTNPTVAKLVSSLAQKQATEFSWQRCAHQTWKAMQTSLSQPIKG